MRRVLALLASFVLTFQLAGVFSATPLGAEGGPCSGDGSSGKRIHLWYAWQTRDSYAIDVARIRRVVAEADARLAAVGGQHYRFLCTAGQVRVDKIRISSPDLASFKSALRAWGHTSVDRLYNAFLPEGTRGMGDVVYDDRADPRVNAANLGPRYSVQPINVDMMMHEIGHNLGAVQRSAPHSSGGAHCWDEPDVMCYNDGASYFQAGGQVQTRCNAAVLGGRSFWDCNLDDYYNPNPPPGSYLATHWNIRNSHFLTAIPATPPPAPRNLRMTDNTASSITMSWDAVYDANGIALYSLEMRRTGTGDYSIACETTATSCGESGSALLLGRSFEFRVRAQDRVGTWGPYSAVVQGNCATAYCI